MNVSDLAARLALGAAYGVPSFEQATASAADDTTAAPMSFRREKRSIIYTPLTSVPIRAKREVGAPSGRREGRAQYRSRRARGPPRRVSSCPDWSWRE